MGLSYKQLYRRFTAWEHFVRKVSPCPSCKRRAHCPVTEPGRNNMRGANRRQSLCMDSNSEDAGPASLRQKSTRPTDGDAVSLLPLWSGSHIWVRTHYPAFSTQFIQKFKKWTFPQKTNDPPHTITTPYPCSPQTLAKHMGVNTPTIW